MRYANIRLAGWIAVLTMVVCGPTALHAQGQHNTASPDDRQLSGTLRNAPIPPGHSPYLPDGRTQSGSGGPIPCRCIYRGQAFSVGESVCVVLPESSRRMRCQLIENNTSWVPSTEAQDCNVAM